MALAQWLPDGGDLDWRERHLLGEPEAVFWADQSTFGSEVLSYRNPETNEWVELPFRRENLPAVMVHLSDDLGEFLADLLAGDLADRLEALD